MNRYDQRERERGVIITHIRSLTCTLGPKRSRNSSVQQCALPGRQTSQSRMAWVMKLGILLAVLIRTVLTDQDIKKEGEYHILLNINYYGEYGEYCLMFRSSAGESLLLWNTSNPLENSTLAAEFRDRLVLEKPLLYVNSLTQSDSGRYRMECWTDGRVSHRDSKDLLVCSGSNEKTILHVHLGETVKLQCEGTRSGANMTVRWFRERDSAPRLDGREQLVEKSFCLLINVTMEDLKSYYMCMILEGQLCVSRHLFYTRRKRQYVVLAVGDEAVLPCFNHDPKGTETVWLTSRFGYIRWVPSHLTSGGKQMYLTDGRTSGNFSLVIPSLMLNHSGWYECSGKPPKKAEYIKEYDLLVCPKAEPLTEFFSEGEEVVLGCNYNLTESNRVVWYRRTAQVDDAILDTRLRLKNLPQDLDGRMNASHPPSFLVLSNLSLADSGEYWCAVFYEEMCVSVTKTLLLVWDPFGINSTFYRVYSSLMGCALLGMVCAVITVNLKTRRRRDQTSLKTQRTAAQTQGQQSSRVEEERGE